MRKFILILTVIFLFLSCCAKHPNTTQARTVNASSDENDKTKPLMIGGKQCYLDEKTLTLDDIDDIEILVLDIDPLDSYKMNSLEGIEQLYNAQNLESIRIYGTNLNTVDLSPLEQFTNITELDFNIWGNSRVLPDLSAFKSLRRLAIFHVTFEQPYTLNLPPRLTGLRLEGNKNLHYVDLSVVETLHDLRWIQIYGKITKLPNLTKLENLRTIALGEPATDGVALESLEGIGAPNAERIRIWNGKKIDSIAPLNSLLNLEHLEIRSLGEGEFKLENLPNLEHLEISMDGKVNLQGIVNLPSLRHLKIAIFGKIDLQGIEKLQYLEHLDIYHPGDVNIEGVGKLKTLKFLRIPLISPKPSLEFLRNMPNLTDLCLTGAPRNGEVYQVLDLAPLATLKKLRLFDCNDFIIKNISALDGLEALCAPDEDVYVRPFLWLDGSRLYDETEKSRYTIWFENMSG
jgi:hypothetical protein